ncbi:MAG: DUF2088 domain-containing protein [Methanobacteriota archaeon]|nr:MAG: DUF2088 domain-containing protein [Euryarchaeota archaeon]
MEYIGQLVYGDKILEGIIPENVREDGRLIECCAPEGYPPIVDVRQKLKEVISHPIGPEGTLSLKEIVQSHYKGGLCTISVDDHTRENIHTKILLPILFEELRGLGVREENARVIISSGTHRSPHENEFPKILGDDIWIRHRERVVVHDCNENLAILGEIDGVPVEINRFVYDSEIYIPLSDLDFHYFAGVAGGPKQICPGICGEKIITAEHLKMFGGLGFAENVESGIVDGNPVFDHKIKIVRLVLERLAEKGTHVYSILSVVNPEGQLVQISGGNIFETHKQDRKILDKVYIIPVDRKADVTIVGAMSKGLDVYQAEKAINTAYRATKRGGKILLVAPCQDGIGNKDFRNLMNISSDVFESMEEQVKSSSNPEEVIEKNMEIARKETQKEAMRDFKIGMHKPVDLLRMLDYVGWGHLYIVQDGIPPDEKKLLPFEYVGAEGESPLQRIRNWVEDLEAKEKPDYLLIEDPGYLFQAPSE